MKISSSGYINNDDPLKKSSETKAAEKIDPKGSGSSKNSSQTGNDQISISDRAKEIARITEIIGYTPDIRASKVDSLKQSVDSGNYSVSSEKVAEKMLNEIRQESGS